MNKNQISSISDTQIITDTDTIFVCRYDPSISTAQTTMVKTPTMVTRVEKTQIAGTVQLIYT